MAVSIPDDARRQPDGGLSMDDGGGFAASLSWKGPYNSLAAAAANIAYGDAIPEQDDLPGNWYVSSFDLKRVNADNGVLTVAGRIDPPSSSSSGGVSTPIRDLWSLKSVRNDVSILAYCGTSANNPNRVAIEKWLKESDGELANGYAYREADGKVVSIAAEPEISYSIPVIKKLQEGTESVIRFYPQVMRRRTYYKPPADVFENLGYVNEPSYQASDITFAPDGLSEVIANHEWLKVQDDCDEQGDGKWLRTESWIGILKASSPDGHPWDPDLYGEDRWDMPADAPGEVAE